MDKFDKSKYLADMYADDYFPKFLVDKIKVLIEEVVSFLEQGEHSEQEIQNKFDKMTIGINELDEEFYDNGSEIETAARESIAQTVDEIIKHFGLDLDVETAIQERDW